MPAPPFMTRHGIIAKIPAFALAALLCAAPFGAPGAASAQPPVQCRVTSVHDGDSMRVRCPGERDTIRVRMHQIDAPELEQPHGKQSRDQLRRLCPRGSEVQIRAHDHDQYGRLLGDLSCGGTNVNEAMVASGAAWVYDRHVRDRRLYRLQEEAQAARRGLWARPNPVAPWRWRYLQR